MPLKIESGFRLAEFDSSVRTYEQFLLVSEPFCKLDEYFESPNDSSGMAPLEAERAQDELRTNQGLRRTKETTQGNFWDTHMTVLAP